MSFTTSILPTKLVQSQQGKLEIEHSFEIKRLIRQKEIIAACLIPIFFCLALFSLFNWTNETFFALDHLNGPIKDLNKIFFDEFFTILILVDVLLLLFSLLHTDDFNKIMRNSGFVISTIFIKLSFGFEGIVSTLVLVAAVAFGIAIFAIHNLKRMKRCCTNEGYSFCYESFHFSSIYRCSINPLVSRKASKDICESVGRKFNIACSI